MKFKVWDKEKKKFVELEGGYYIHSSGALCYFGNAGMGFADKRYQSALSTGVIGKNEVELFDGDIVKASIYEGEDEQILEIKSKNNVFVIDYDDGDIDCFLVVDFPGILEKIGTKFEKPELLK